MILTGCLKMNELHESIRWDVIFLLAGVIPPRAGSGEDRRGGTPADSVVKAAGDLPPLVILIIYSLALGLTAVISNHATAVVSISLGVTTTEALSLDPRALILTIMFAASTSFATPIGYQTNVTVYGPRGYRLDSILGFHPRRRPAQPPRGHHTLNISVSSEGYKPRPSCSLASASAPA